MNPPTIKKKIKDWDYLDWEAAICLPLAAILIVCYFIDFIGWLL